MTDSATNSFDKHALWSELDTIDEWLEEASNEFNPGFAGLPALANSFLRRIQVVVTTTRIFLDSTTKEAISKDLLDEIKRELTRISVEIQDINWNDGETDWNEVLGEANDASGALLSVLYKIGKGPIEAYKVEFKANDQERKRIEKFLTHAQNIITELETKQQSFKTRINEDLEAGLGEITELQEEVESVAGRFSTEIDEGVSAGKQRIDDQISTLQSQYSAEIEHQRENAKSDMEEILNQIRVQKSELDEMVAETKRVSGYVAENAMSRMFKERADDSKTLWLWFTGIGAVVAIISAFLLWLAGRSAWEAQSGGPDIVQGLIRTIMGLGAAGVAAYLFRQANILQQIFQNFRSAEVRIGSLDAFLAQFEAGDAQEIRRGVGQRVYVDGELGEIDGNKIDSKKDHARPKTQDSESTTDLDSSETDK